MTGTVTGSSAHMSERRRRKRGEGEGEEERQSEMDTEEEEKDLYSGAQTRPDQARLVWVARKPARRLI